ncbi:MAG: 4Fe-4S binding protein [Erysipelotrichaceae bacterium]|nr:4Fe-4S binding protein [Erysipelotrichaceae bacterium]
MPARVDKDMCIGCGACVGVCPTEAITMQDDGKAFVDEAACIDCGACVATCPVGAISQ